MPTSAQPGSRELPTSRAGLERVWADGLGATGYVPLAHEEIDQVLSGALGELIDALGRPEFSARPATAVGARLVRTGFTGERSLGVTVEILGSALPAQDELAGVENLPGRVVSLLGALVTGYTGEFRRWTLDQQEAAKRALLRAKDEAERARRVSEARFREVFESAPLGVAISALNGSITDSNAALSEILGEPPAELAGRNIGELFHRDDAGRLSVSYQELAMGRRHRYRTRAKLATLEDANWGSVSVSVLRDADDNPTHHVTMVEDFGDVHLLEQQLRHQTLHDLLTGLPNQEYFWIHLRAMLEGAGPGAAITLCKIDLDRFAAVNDGHGHEAGNQVLRTVARRLQALVVGEQAMVARFGADEFALIIVDSAATRDVAGLAAEINAVLSEPVRYGGHALTVSAGVGAVRRPAREMSATELVRAADATLHRAKRSGRGQWGLHDPRADADERARYGLATEMPVAWDDGLVEPCYQPVVGLGPDAGDRITAIVALLRWAHPQHGVVGHDECVELAGRTGLILSLGPWLLRQACRQLHRWREEFGAAVPPIRVDLTPDLAQDPDLVAVVQGALTEARLQPGDVQLGIPLTPVPTDSATEDNLRVLADAGICTVLTCWETVGTLAILEAELVSAVDVADHLVRAATGQAATGQPASVLREALSTLVPLVRRTGATVFVAGVDSAEQADWWRQAGADSARGAVFGPPCGPDEMARLLAP